MWRGLGLSWGWGGEGKGLVPWPWAGPVPTGPTAQALTARGCGPWGSGVRGKLGPAWHGLLSLPPARAPCPPQQQPYFSSPRAHLPSCFPRWRHRLLKGLNSKPRLSRGPMAPLRPCCWVAPLPTEGEC